MERKKLPSKDVVFFIGINALFALAIIIVFFFLRPKKVELGKGNADTTEAVREAMFKHEAALIDLASEQAKTKQLFAEKDSAIINEIRETKKAIQNSNKRDETIKRVNNYGSAELAWYFSNLPEPR